MATKLKEYILLVRLENKHFFHNKKQSEQIDATEIELKGVHHELSTCVGNQKWQWAPFQGYYLIKSDAAAVPAETSWLVERWPYMWTWRSRWSGVGKQVWVRNSLTVSFSHQYTYVLLCWNKLSWMTEPLEETALWQDNMYEKKVRLNSMAVLWSV